MRIGLVALGGVGGSTIATTQLADNLSRMGHTVFFFALKKPLRLSPNIKLFLPYKPVYPVLANGESDTVEFASLLINKANDLDINILHFNYAYPFISIIPIIKRSKPEVRTILSFHGTDVTYFSSDRRYQKLFETVIHDVDHLTFVSEFLKKRFRLCTSNKSCEVVPNFVESTRGIFPDRNDIIHVSNLRPAKRFDDVLDVFKKVKRSVKDIKLHVIGNEKEFSADSDIISYGIMENIFPVLEKRKLSLLTSESEGFSLFALESMSCGVPVVATRAGGIEEVVSDDETGLLHEVGDTAGIANSIKRLYKDGALYNRFSEKCIETVNNKFLAKNIICKYLNIYKRVLNSNADTKPADNVLDNKEKRR
ncbi:MAG: glycosyltransferase [Planctomycetes bacterium]|nr:glycosyltransferase [Planctomycetota bacterium]